MRTTTTSLALITLAGIASAEPIVAVLPAFEPEGWYLTQHSLRQYNHEFPNLVVFSHNAGGGGVSEVRVQIECASLSDATCDDYNDVEVALTDHNNPDWPWPAFERDTAPGTTVPGPQTDGLWQSISLFLNESVAMPTLRFYDNKYYALSDCDFAPANAEFIELSPVFYYPARIRQPDNSYIYGWVATQVVDALSTDCELDPGDCDGQFYTFCSIPLLRILGVGFETEPDTAIIVGGGLCPADLNADAVLDLADVQAFATAFIGMEPAADFDDNGLYDLADIQSFVTGFNTNCGL